MFVVKFSTLFVPRKSLVDPEDLKCKYQWRLRVCKLSIYAADISVGLWYLETGWFLSEVSRLLQVSKYQMDLAVSREVEHVVVHAAL